MYSFFFLLISLAEAKPRCHWTHFSGAVKQGEAFERKFGRNLVFYLRPENEPMTPGWTIEVHPQTDGEDLVGAATPPYRFWNPRYLNVSYGYTAQQSVEMNVRAFRFFARLADYEAAGDALDKLLWPYNYSKEAVEAAGHRLDALPKYDGKLRILDARTGGAPPGRIEWIKFQVELCAPE